MNEEKEKRYQEAIDYLLEHRHPNIALDQLRADVAKILDPPPEMEEKSIWLNIYRNSDGKFHTGIPCENERQALNRRMEGLVSTEEIKVKVAKPQARKYSQTMTGIRVDGDGRPWVERVPGGSRYANIFENFPATRNKRGYLVFHWEEPQPEICPVCHQAHRHGG